MLRQILEKRKERKREREGDIEIDRERKCWMAKKNKDLQVNCLVELSLELS